jgi:4-hydroxy-tetrahydrodipicolinate synthase
MVFRGSCHLFLGCAARPAGGPVMRELRPDQLLGSYVPLITPFTQGAVDYHAFAGLVEWHVANGTHGVVVCSNTTGEATMLTTTERRCLAAVAVEVAACRVEVVIATESQTAGETAELTEHASAAGADSVILVVPSNHDLARDGLVAYFADLAACGDLPALLHRRPTLWRGIVDINTLTELAFAVPNLVGVLQSGADLAFVSEAVMTFGLDFRIIADVDEMSYFMLAAGAHGIVNPLANLLPAAVAALYYSVVKDGLAEGLAAHHRLYDLNRALRFDTDPIPLKYLMWRLGLLAPNETSAPMPSVSAALASRLDALLAASSIVPFMESSDLV